MSTSIVMFSSEHNLLGIVNGVDREKQPNADQPGNKKTHTHTHTIYMKAECLPKTDINKMHTAIFGFEFNCDMQRSRCC